MMIQANKSFVGRYIHINTYRKYEIIGSSKNAEDGCTLCIEGANLASVHCEIRLKEAYNYYITPLSDTESDDVEDMVNIGTFIRVPEEGIDLYSLKNNKILKFGDTIAGVMFTTEEFKEVEIWIKSNYLENISPIISELGIKYLKDLKLHTETIINKAFSDKIINDFEEAKIIRMKFNDIEVSQSSRKKCKRLIELHFPQTNINIELNGDYPEHRLGPYLVNLRDTSLRVKKHSQDKRLEPVIKYK